MNHKARCISEGIAEGLKMARELVAREAQQEFIDGHAGTAEALRNVHQKLHQQVRDYQKALEADEMEHPSGI